ncbi:hypothetical protein BBF96_08965 [Anoxybacter fermentans]|uniref:Fibronectin type-III domain-containing protein n=1 Tax=Anoxybacter fermentans TaxID=1323375 RepID=A0A3Q9HQL9_9FIRM|nr:PKD domain-containing protein [Anoxybacter fermentans]AZR73504.1 hypothetical protein BBF96_08965 [Anoxybacter fermentans]
MRIKVSFLIIILIVMGIFYIPIFAEETTVGDESIVEKSSEFKISENEGTIDSSEKSAENNGEEEEAEQEPIPLYELWQNMIANQKKLEFPEGEELIEKRTEFTKTFKQPGKEVLFLSSSPLHYKDENGEWQDIDTTLKKESNFLGLNFTGYEHSVKKNSLQVFFGNTLKKGIKLERKGYTLKIKLLDTRGTENEVNGNIKRYIDVWENVDVQYEVYAGVLKEYIILKDKNARNSFEFQIKTNKDMEISQIEEGLIFSDSETGEEIFRLDNPFVFDRNSLKPDFDNISLSYEQKKKTINLKVTISRDWLESNEREFPVVIDPTFLTVTVHVGSKSEKFTITKSQIISWSAMLDDEGLDIDYKFAIFYIMDSAGTKLVYLKTWDGPIYKSGDLYLIPDTYTVFVQSGDGCFYDDYYYTTTATLTFYDEATLIPKTPNDGIYREVQKFSWSYDDPQGFNQERIKLVIKDSSGNVVRTYYKESYSERSVEYNPELPTGLYKWSVIGYNGKIWSDYVSWNSFEIDRTPPAPSGGILNLNQNLNTVDGDLCKTIESAYKNETKLKATISWNQFIDMGASGLKEIHVEYKKNGESEWNLLTKTLQNNCTLEVDWNSIYQYRVRGVDEVDNTSAWYYSATFATPALPTEITDVSFNKNLATVEFKVHDQANAYKIRWKNTSDNNDNGETGWIEIPDNFTGDKYRYTILTENYKFSYGQVYEFSIATRNAVNDKNIFYFGALTVEVPNTPPVPPDLVSPRNGTYLKNSYVSFVGTKTTDPDGQQIEYKIRIQKRVQGLGWFGFTWMDYKTLYGYTGSVTLEDGHYRWRLEASDQIDTSYSDWWEFYVDTTGPIQPSFDLLSTDNESITATRDTGIKIHLTRYTGNYYNYPYPEDYARNNDVYYFKVTSNLDEPVIIYKSQLVDNTIEYTLTPVNGEHLITVTSYDIAGNYSSTTHSIIFDNQAPKTIEFTNPLDKYFSNSGTEVTFTWPAAIDQPSGTNSQIAKYIVMYERPESGISNTIETVRRSVTVNLNYNEEVKFKVRAVDGAGNKGNWSEVVWYSLPEPTSISGHTISINEVSPGVYQQEIKLNIKPAKCSYYQIYRENLTNPDEGVLISNKIYVNNSNTDTWTFIQKVDPHQQYKYYVKTYNPKDKFVKGYETIITIPNNPPAKPDVTISGLTNGYLTDKDKEITIKASSYDYDNDDLTYHYTVIEDGATIISKDSTNTSYYVSDLKEGSNYRIQVDVTDGISTVSSNTISFTVDTMGPEIIMTAPPLEYVASQEVVVEARDAVSGVATLTYQWGETGIAYPISSGSKISAPHGSNKLIVTAVDKAGNKSIAEEIYLVDKTAPEIDYVNIQAQKIDGNYYVTNNNEVYINFQFSDDLTTITSYKYGLLEEGQSLNSISLDQLPERSVAGLTVYTGEQRITGDLVDGKTYYPVIAVYNQVGRTTGLVKIEPGFTVDGSGPEISNLTVTGLKTTRTGTYLTDLATIGFAPTIVDTETGVERINYGITDIPGTEPTQWYDSFSNLKSNVELKEGKTYYFVVEAENRVGLSTRAYSEGFIVDTVGPEFTSIIGGKEIPNGSDTYVQRRNDYLEVTWTIEDISTISNYYYRVGTVPGSGNISQNFADADQSGWVAINSTDYEVNLLISEPGFTFEDGTYYITIKAVDEAGNETLATTNPIQINSKLPPVPTVNTDGIYVSEKDKIHFTVNMINPEQDIIGYRYRIIDRLGNQVVDWKYISTSESFVDIIETGDGNINLIDGKEYFIQVQVQYQDNTYTDSGWASVIIDSTPPTNLIIEYPDYASSEQLAVSWRAEEDFSRITYQAKVGTSAGANDILDWIQLGRKNQYIFEDLQILDGEIVYITIMAENSSGLSTTNVSGPIIIDNTPPPVPLVIDKGMYTNDNTKLTISWTWTQEDPESGTKEYQVALLKSREINDNIEWIPVTSDDKNYTFNQTLDHGSVYFVAVKAINNAGLSSIGISDGILVDITKPTPPTINDFGDYTDSLTTLKAEFVGAKDPESGLAAFYYSLGTFENPNLLVNNEEVSGTTIVGRDDLNLELGQVYFFEAIAKNGAGEVSALTISDGIMVIDGTQPQISQVLDGGDYSIDSEKLSFIWDVNDPTIPIDHYEYVLLTDLDEVVDDSKWMSTKAKRVDLTSTEVLGKRNGFADGSTYYLAVRVINKLNRPTGTVVSDGITVDSSPPEEPILDLDEYVNNNFKLKWNASDPHSGIKGYMYAVGTTRGGTDVTGGWREIDLTQLNESESSECIDRFVQLNLNHLDTYYLTVKAVNGVGLWSKPVMSHALIADLEPPTKPVVNVPGKYTTSREEILNISFSSSDSESGIVAYRYQVVDNTDLIGNLSTPIHMLNGSINEYTNNDLDITNLNLTEGGIYYVAIQTMDAMGQWSEIGYSEPIIVDTVAPDLSFASGEKELVTNDGTMVVEWTTNENGTVYYRLVRLNDDGTPAHNPDFKSMQVTAGSYSFDFTATEFGKYRYEIYQFDEAGNRTEIITKQVRYNFPPVVELYASSLTAFKGHTLTFSTDAFDPDGEVVKYYWTVGTESFKQTNGIDKNPGVLDFTFTEIGDYVIEITVEDNDGAQMSTSLTVTITNTLEGPLVLDEVWSGKMEMLGTVEVPYGITLKIEPGTVISFPANASLEVYGSIELQGSTDNPIVFTGIEWKGVEIYPSATILKITDVIFGQAERGLTLVGQNTQITNSVFKENVVGLHLYQSQATVTGCEFSNNIYFGIKEDESSGAVVRYSKFIGNGLSPYYDEEMTWIDVDQLNSLPENEGNIQE